MGIVLDILLILSGIFALHSLIVARWPVVAPYIEKLLFVRPWIGLFMWGIALVMLVPVLIAFLFLGLFTIRGLITLAAIVVALSLGTMDGWSLLEHYFKPSLQAFWGKIERAYMFLCGYHELLGKAALVIAVFSLLSLLF